MIHTIATYARIGVLDFALGILAAAIAAAIFDQPIFPTLLLIGIIGAFILDLDGAVYVVTHGHVHHKSAHTHRDLFHRPFWWLIAVLALSFVAPAPAVAFGLALLFHFIHDSIGIGWGVRWLTPFSNNHYKFFSKHDPDRREDGTTLLVSHRDLVAIWHPAGHADVAERHGDVRWVENIYGRWSNIAITETIFAAVCIGVAYLLVR